MQDDATKLNIEVEKVHQPVELGKDTIDKMKAPRSVSTPAQDAEIQLKSEGSRAINLMWETTQMRIALSVTWAALTVSTYLAIAGTQEVKTAAFVFMFGAANLVIGFYFGRTNHTKRSGAGTDPDDR